jgi:hypothetical protein
MYISNFRKRETKGIVQCTGEGREFLAMHVVSFDPFHWAGAEHPELITCCDSVISMYRASLLQGNIPVVVQC